MGDIRAVVEGSDVSTHPRIAHAHCTVAHHAHAHAHTHTYAASAADVGCAIGVLASVDHDTATAGLGNEGVLVTRLRLAEIIHRSRCTQPSWFCDIADGVQGFWRRVANRWKVEGKMADRLVWNRRCGGDGRQGEGEGRAKAE